MLMCSGAVKVLEKHFSHSRRYGEVMRHEEGT